jgi:CheY-like chemotaxis protein
LAISKGLIDFMGGTIKVESETGKGSIFRVSVPVEFTKHHEGEKKQDRGITLRSNLKILIADDDEISSIYLKEILSDFANELHFAGSGSEAIDIIQKKGNIDLVLMDLKMPGMNGYEAARIIRKLNPSIPIIAVSAFTPEEENKKASGGDIDEYVIKPVDRKILFSRIEKVLSSEKSGTDNGYR